MAVGSHLHFAAKLVSCEPSFEPNPYIAMLFYDIAMLWGS